MGHSTSRSGDLLDVFCHKLSSRPHLQWVRLAKLIIISFAFIGGYLFPTPFVPSHVASTHVVPTCVVPTSVVPTNFTDAPRSDGAIIRSAPTAHVRVADPIGSFFVSTVVSFAMSAFILAPATACVLIERHAFNLSMSIGFWILRSLLVLLYMLALCMADFMAPFIAMSYYV